MSYKSEIMESANELMESMVFCFDREFINEVISRILAGEKFDFEEIEEAEDTQE